MPEINTYAPDFSSQAYTEAYRWIMEQTEDGPEGVHPDYYGTVTPTGTHRAQLPDLCGRYDDNEQTWEDPEDEMIARLDAQRLVGDGPSAWEELEDQLRESDLTCGDSLLLDAPGHDRWNVSRSARKVTPSKPRNTSRAKPVFTFMDSLAQYRETGVFSVMRISNRTPKGEDTDGSQRPRLRTDSLENAPDPHGRRTYVSAKEARAFSRWSRLGKAVSWKNRSRADRQAHRVHVHPTL